MLCLVSDQTRQITIDVRLDGDEISGRAGDGSAQPKAFQGWLGLLVSLDGLLVGVIGALLVHNHRTKLSHTAVERYIANTYNVNVQCNDGHDMPVATGRTYNCVGSGVVLAVHMLDNHGAYEVGKAGSSSVS